MALLIVACLCMSVSQLFLMDALFQVYQRDGLARLYHDVILSVVPFSETPSHERDSTGIRILRQNICMKAFTTLEKEYCWRYP
jgi:hypothetical protein